MASLKTKQKKEAFSISSLSLTREDAETLEMLSKDATDFIGRKVSGSAIVRALVRLAREQGYQWVITNLCPFVEAELSSGIMWGKKK